MKTHGGKGTKLILDTIERGNKKKREREQSIKMAKDELILLSSFICDESLHEAGHIWSGTKAH